MHGEAISIWKRCLFSDKYIYVVYKGVVSSSNYRCYTLQLIGLVSFLTENVLYSVWFDKTIENALYSVLFDKKNRSKHVTPNIVLFLCIFTKLLHDAS